MHLAFLGCFVVWMFCAFADSAFSAVLRADSSGLTIDSGRDVFLANVSVLNTTARISELQSKALALSQSRDSLSLAVSALAEHNHLLANSLSELESQQSAMQQLLSTLNIQQPANGNSATTTTVASTGSAQTTTTSAPASTSITSVCPYSQLPQVLPKSYESFATFKSLNGTLFLVAVANSESSLFHWSGDANSSFTLHQTMVTAVDTTKLAAFEALTQNYVVLPYAYDASSFLKYCEVFVFDDATFRLTSWQNISSHSTSGVAAATARTGETFLVISNQYNQTSGSHLAQSYVMKLNSSSGLFYHHQNITTTGALVPSLFEMGSDLLLVIPNNYNDSLASYSPDSPIFKFDVVSGYFVTNGTIITTAANYFLPWLRNRQNYLTALSSLGYVDVLAFKASGGVFVNVTTGRRLAVYGPIGADVTVITGNVFLAVSPGAYVFKWDDVNGYFVQTQHIVTPFVWGFPHFFTIGVDVFLALGNNIFKFCGGQFVVP
jgi:hypothetical protein